MKDVARIECGAKLGEDPCVCEHCRVELCDGCVERLLCGNEEEPEVYCSGCLSCVSD
jgi:hypothetical protein